QALIEEYRTNGGKLSGQLANAKVLLLTTTGAKSGQPRTRPMGYTIDGERILVVASNAGAPRHPAWYHNLVGNPVVTVELDSERFQARAIVPQGEERDQIFTRIAADKPYFIDHQQKVSRTIPVVVLERVG